MRTNTLNRPSKIFALSLILLLFWTNGFCDDHILIKFSSASNVPTYTVNGSGYYVLTTNDANLNSLLSGYNITVFKKEYPSAIQVSHANAEPLNRVFRVATTTGISSLYNSIANLNSVVVSSLFLTGDPVSLTNPNDYSTSFTFCGGASNTGAPLDLINAKTAWDINEGSAAVKIGIVDIGFDVNHPEIVGKYLTSTFQLSSALTGQYHGTQVAGIAGANTNNGIGVASIGNKCSLKFYDWTYNNMIDAAIGGCRVINCSFLSGCSPITFEQDLINMLKDTYNVVFVAGAGNGVTGGHCGTTGNDPVYPASYNNVISVTTVGHMFNYGTAYACLGAAVGFGWKDIHDQYTSTTTTNGAGPTYQQYTFTHNGAVDLTAPGYGVPVLTQSSPYYSSYGGYGTSFSSPYVAGLAGLILSVNPNIPATDVEKILKCSASDNNVIAENYNYRGLIGIGRIDATAALMLAQGWPNSLTGSSFNAAPSDITWAGRNGTRGTFTPIANPTASSLTTYTQIQLTANTTAAPSSVKWIIDPTHDPCNPLPVTVLYGNPIILNSASNYSANCYLYVSTRVNACVPSAYYNESILPVIGPRGPQCPCTRVGSNQLVLSNSISPENLSVENSSSIKVFPNPASTYAMIENTNANLLLSTLTLVDLNGRELKKAKVTQWPYKLNLSAIPIGEYIIKISSSTYSISKKLTVAR